ncbi:MAG TPA: hypothetical protein VKR29_00560 [Candidatus Binataceae bacterium]|nr:hypothetical protein [Candidatus Binataceae bacterium]
MVELDIDVIADPKPTGKRDNLNSRLPVNAGENGADNAMLIEVNQRDRGNGDREQKDEGNRHDSPQEPHRRVRSPEMVDER